MATWRQREANRASFLRRRKRGPLTVEDQTWLGEYTASLGGPVSKPPTLSPDEILFVQESRTLVAARLRFTFIVIANWPFKLVPWTMLDEDIRRMRRIMTGGL